MMVYITIKNYYTIIFLKVKPKSGNEIILFKNFDKLFKFFNRRFCFYDCTATRPSRENNTKEDTIEPGTETIAIKMNPRTTDRMVKCYVDATTENQSVYNAWFNAVHEKGASI